MHRSALVLTALIAAAAGLPAAAQAQNAPRGSVSLQRGAPQGSTGERLMVRIAVGTTFTPTPGRLVITRDGDDLVVTNPGGPGVKVVDSGAGEAACVAASRFTAVRCRAAGVTAIEALLDASDDVVDASAVDIPLFADGKAGNDTLLVGPTRLVTVLVGGPGDDIINGGEGQDFITGDTTADPRVAGNDLLTGNGDGDHFTPGPGSDVVDGGVNGRAVDFVNYFEHVGTGATVTLGDGLCNDGTPTDVARSGSTPAEGCSANGVDRDLLRGIEAINGTRQSDDIVGDDGPNSINGFFGADRLEGGLGADQLLGGADADVLFARDGVVDTATVCGTVPEDRTPGDRALADPGDPVDPSCVEIQRGAAGTTGPVGTPPQDPEPAPAEQPADPGFAPFPEPTPTPAVVPDQPATGESGPGPGGSDGGVTPPELLVTSPAATVIKGVAELRVRCVYQAKNCVGTVRLVARATTRAGKGRKRVTVKKDAVLGTQTVDIPWGTSEPTRIAVGRGLKRLFAAGARRIKATLTVTAHDGAAPAGAADATVTRNVLIGRSG